MGKIIIFSGAGISAPSGMKTFRDNNGFWNNHNVDEICSYKVWENIVAKNDIKSYLNIHNFYNDLRTNLKNLEPNIAHKTIAKWQEEYGEEKVINITQNVDDLFEKAGVKNTIHIHGFLPEIYCNNCQKIYNIGYEKFYPLDEVNNKKTKCTHCGSTFSKPNIVFFGEYPSLYHDAKNILNNITPDDILIVIGTLGNVFQIDLYAKYLYNSNWGNPPLMILNNLEKSEFIKEKHYKYKLYESCETAILLIDKIIKSKL